MTDITNTAPITFRRLGYLCLKLPKLGIGIAIAAISEDIRHAATLAYVAPFSAMQLKHPIALDVDLEGRDSNW